MKRFTKLLAFTLAETLIVMGIIGVVAALTIPNLNSSTADKEKVAKLKKVYSNLNDTFGRVEAVYGNMAEWSWSMNGTTETSMLAERMGDFLKVSKTCGLTANQGCLPASLKYLNGTAYSPSFPVNDKDTSSYKYILADGTGLGIRASSGTIYMIVDIDGPNKGASTLGKDVFDFYISRALNSALSSDYNTLLSDMPNGANKLTNVTDLSSNFKSDLGLATWVLQTDNMDYLKATDGKCKITLC